MAKSRSFIHEQMEAGMWKLILKEAVIIAVAVAFDAVTKDDE